MGALIFILFLLSAFLIFILPRSLKYGYTLLITSGMIGLTTLWSIEAFNSADAAFHLHYQVEGWFEFPEITIDRLSAFFILVVNFTIFTGILFAHGYLKAYSQTKKPLIFSIHYFAWLWLYFSMLLVLMIRDGFAFLIVWELMSLASFLLVIFDAEDRSTLKTGINYLIQMHVGFALILVAFLITEKATGQMGFNGLQSYFSNRSNILLFLLFFIGFGIKAGFIPLHTWLPEAHPAAPSHVSGVMSGVMIKMGIYGIMRVMLSLQSDLLWIGTIVLVISLISGVLGVMTAIIQHDLKRLLAYHSIENIGIIGIGLGLGIIGKATGNDFLALLGLSGGLLHVMNHSLFKSLLFYGAGSVYRSTHTRMIDHLGGLIKRMPFTAFSFLIGSLAICGLPPFNGFISEYLIYLGMVKSLSGAGVFQIITILFSIIGLTLIGGLAIFCFTKAFGMVFLGQFRTQQAAEAEVPSKSMMIPQILVIALILLIGFGSPWFVKPVFSLISDLYLPGISPATGDTSLGSLVQISILGGIFVVIAATLLLFRRNHLKSKSVASGPTWGCGYTAGTSKQQYTATSYADNFAFLANPLMGNRKVFRSIESKDIFPQKRKFLSHNYDVFKRYLVDNPITLLQELLKKIAVMQTGQIQHYILYAFVFMLIVFVLTFFKII